MASIRLNALVTVLTPLSHIGELNGVTAMFNRIAVITPDGNKDKVPYISGNSVRGILRDCLAEHLFTTAELPPLSMRAFHLLFSGGSLTKGDGPIKVDQLRQLRELIPSLGLLGGSTRRHIMAGKLVSGLMRPVAYETRNLLPESFRRREAAETSIYTCLQMLPFTRTDDAKRDELPLSKYIRKEDLAAYMTSRAGDGDEGGQAAEANVAQQMRTEAEMLIPGTELHWYVYLDDATELEELAFYAALWLWAEHPSLGGKRGTGHGLVRVEFDNKDRWVISPDEVVLPDARKYAAYLAKHSREIAEVLDAI